MGEVTLLNYEKAFDWLITSRDVNAEFKGVGLLTISSIGQKHALNVREIDLVSFCKCLSVFDNEILHMKFCSQRDKKKFDHMFPNIYYLVMNAQEYSN